LPIDESGREILLRDGKRRLGLMQGGRRLIERGTGLVGLALRRDASFQQRFDPVPARFCSDSIRARSERSFCSELDNAACWLDRVAFTCSSFWAKIRSSIFTSSCPAFTRWKS
jgi:hypothetical protein